MSAIRRWPYCVPLAGRVPRLWRSVSVVNLPASVAKLLIDERTRRLLVDFESCCGLLRLDHKAALWAAGAAAAAACCVAS